jgi:UDP-GlcNAc:undecaprenyl-phosphate GlcNAc-1-phosphate transferase
MCYCDFVLYSLWKIYSRTGNMNKTSLSWLIGVTIIAKFVSLLGKKLSGMPMFNELFEWVTLSFGVSALSSFLIVSWFARTKKQGQKRDDTSAVQASHLNPTARLGGLALFIALIVAAALSHSTDNWIAFVLLLVSAIPVFVIGLAEDLGYLASPRKRLLAATVSGAMFIALMGQWVLHTGIPGLDVALHWSPFAVAFSLFLAVGISHSFNLIDGLNGFAGFTALAAALALATIAHQSELTEHRDILLTIAAAVTGFLIFNFPFGKIFLGDAGAYVIGHLLFWMSVSILWNAPDISPFAMLLIFFWPIADTLLAITRRLSLGKPIVQPDKLHFHQLVMRGVEIVFLGRQRRHIANPLAALFTLPFVFAPMITAVMFALDPGAAAMAYGLFAVVFIATYKTGMWIAPKLRRSACPKKYATANGARRTAAE